MHLHERRAKCLWTVPEDSPPVICCNSLRRTNRSTIPRSCRAYRKDQAVRSKAANRRCPRVAVMPRQERMRHLLSRLLPGLVEHVSLFPREFRRPIRICNIGKTNELLRIVPAVIPRVCAGATGVLPLGLGG